MLLTGNDRTQTPKRVSLGKGLQNAGIGIKKQGADGQWARGNKANKKSRTAFHAGCNPYFWLAGMFA